ncbi:MAG: YkvA family protein [Syntrophomonadaceae bacterium]|jgi:uncharacterized membrane protein YkvA (DUF1232 family)
MNEKNEAKSQAAGFTKEALSFIPNLVKLLYRLGQDKSVSAADKALLLMTIAYVFSPWDFLPDLVPFLGQVDDLFLLALVLKRLLDSVDHNIVLQYWDGSENLLLMINRVLEYSANLLPPRVRRLLLKKSRRTDYIDAEYDIR